jgi:hypothetical protein
MCAYYIQPRWGCVLGYARYRMLHIRLFIFDPSRVIRALPYV